MVTTVKKKIGAATAAPAPAHDQFVPDSQVRAELSISPMTMWRMDRDPRLAELGWPPPMRPMANGYKYRSRLALEKFKQNMLQRALAARGGKAA